MKDAAAALLILFTLCRGGTIQAQESELYRSWNQPITPFKIIGNIYYVGANEITSFLIATEEGHIILDGGFAETAPIILQNIETLGFEPGDVKILLNSHAHLDHAGGLAALKAVTGARLYAMQQDRALLEAGGKGDFLLGDDALFPPVTLDVALRDSSEVTLDTTTLTAHLTPGHTMGCTTWSLPVTHAGENYNVVFVGSASVLPKLQLIDNPNYPGVADDYRKTFHTLRSLDCDVFLGSHGVFFKLLDKSEQLKSSEGRNPFVDPEGYQKYVERAEQRFLTRLKQEELARSQDGN